MSEDNSIGNFVGETAHGFLKSFLKENKTKMDKFLLTNKLGFVPEGMDFSNYKKIQEKNVFKQLKFLIGKKHPTLGIILMGMHLASFPYEKRKECVEKHRNEVYDKHGAKGVSVLNMALTGFINVYIKWLADYNVEKNPSQKELIDLYEKILDEWNHVSLFIQKSKSNSTIRNRIVNKMASSLPFIYIFASESAIKKWRKVLVEIKKEGLLTEYDYQFTSYNLHESNYEKVWIFENVSINS